MKRLNTYGLAHYILPVIVVVTAGLIGMYLLVGSHADSRANTGTIKVIAKKCNKPLKLSGNVGGVKQFSCPGKLVKFIGSLRVDVSGAGSIGQCNGVTVKSTSSGSDTLVGKTGSLRCTPGNYGVSLGSVTRISKSSYESYLPGQYVDVTSGKIKTLTLYGQPN